jgi:predicted alpha/beta-hydrolase family hydrolase
MGDDGNKALTKGQDDQKMTHKVVISVGEGQEVSGILSIPEGEVKKGVILAHGAGNYMDQPMLAFLADGLSQAGYLALRFNFLYRELGRKAPDIQEKLYQAWDGAYRFVRKYPVERIVASGKSMGGRIASQMVSEGKLPVEQLIFLGYPLHAPGKKDKLRDQHLYKIGIPMRFFVGTRDQLCDLELLRGVLSHLDVAWDLEVIEGGDHSFNVPKSISADPKEIYGRILTKALVWLAEEELR